jgi:hypothetical protein
MLQKIRLPGMDVPVKPQTCLDDKTMKEMPMIEDREIEEFKFENETLKNNLKVGNISVCKIRFTLNSWKLLYKIIIIIIIINSYCPLCRSKGLSRSFSIYFCLLPTTSLPP